VFETQPDPYADGDETVGSVNGATRGELLGNDLIGNITVAAGESGVGYNFAEVFVAS
jgi:hypothetical protein